MKYTLLVLLFPFCLFSQTGYTPIEIDSIKGSAYKYFYFGVELTHPNYSGIRAPELEEISLRNRSSLVDFASKFSFGINISTERIFKKNTSFSFIPEVGLSIIKGHFKLREYGGSYVGSDVIGENRLDINFQSTFLYSSYGIQYRLGKKLGIGILLAPKIAVRVTNKGKRITENYSVNYKELPIDSQFNGARESDNGYDFTAAQLYFKTGINKAFQLKSSVITIGVLYEMSLLRMHSPSNFESNPLSISVKYGLKNKKYKSEKEVKGK